MIDANDSEAKAAVELRFIHGTLLMCGKPYMYKGQEISTCVAVNDSMDDAWAKLVEEENKRTEYPKEQ